MSAKPNVPIRINVALVGPKQAGMTTLAYTFAGKPVENIVGDSNKARKCDVEYTHYNFEESGGTKHNFITTVEGTLVKVNLVDASGLLSFYAGPGDEKDDSQRHSTKFDPNLNFYATSFELIPEATHVAPFTPLFVVGTRNDSASPEDRTEERRKEREAGVRELGCEYRECSARTGDCVKELLEEVIWAGLKKKRNPEASKHSVAILKKRSDSLRASRSSIEAIHSEGAKGDSSLKRRRSESLRMSKGHIESLVHPSGEEKRKSTQACCIS